MVFLSIRHAVMLGLVLLEASLDGPRRVHPPKERKEREE